MSLYLISLEYLGLGSSANLGLELAKPTPRQRPRPCFVSLASHSEDYSNSKREDKEFQNYSSLLSWTIVFSPRFSTNRVWSLRSFGWPCSEDGCGYSWKA